MDASEASCSSRNLATDGPTLPYCGGTGGESVHESRALASDGSNTPIATMLESHAVSPRNVTATIKVNPTLPKILSTSVIQSSWIQRLKPFSQSNTPEEEPVNVSMKKSPICTHFTKDFSSCSRRLNKSSHHTRSSSWPSHALRLQGAEHFPLELGEPVDIKEGYCKAAVISPSIEHQNIQVQSNNITHSSDAGSRTGNLFAQQQNSCQQASAVEAFIPCALSRENLTLKRLNVLQERERGGDSKPKHCLAQQIQSSNEDFKKVSSGGEHNVALRMKTLVQAEEANKNRDYSYGSCGASKGDIHAPVPSVSAYRVAQSSGASADADEKVRFAECLDCCMGNKMLTLQTSFVKPDCETALPTAVVSENRVNMDKAGENWCFERGNAQTGIVSKDVRNFGCLQTERNFKQFKESVAKPYVLNNLSDARASSTLHGSSRNSYLAEAFSNVRCAVESRTVAALGSLKQDALSKRLDAFCSRENNLADFKNPHLSDGDQTSTSTLPAGALHEDATRSRIREISLGEYWNTWVRLLEGPDNVKPAHTGSPMSKSPQNYCVGGYDKNLFQPASSNARQKFEEYCRHNPHKHVSDDSGNFGTCDLPQQILSKSSKKYEKLLDHRKWLSQMNAGWGQEHYASANQSFHFSLQQKSQTHDLRGATGRVDSQPHNDDSHRRFLHDGASHSRMHSTNASQQFCNNERTGEGSSMHQVWIRRWYSSARSGKAPAHVPYLSRSLSSDQLGKSYSASAQCPLICSDKALGSFDRNLTESGRGSDRNTEASGTRLDSGSASTTPSPRRNFAAFRSGYVGSCAGAMAAVGKSASKLPPSSLPNRGFCGLPCTGPKLVKCEVVLEDEVMHSVDSEELKTLERYIEDG